jgi:RHS repeat-associated protein
MSGLYFYQNDPNGCPIRVMDQDGRAVWTARYDPLGAINEVTANEIENPLRLQGHYEDQETGLCCSRYRFFDPSTGNFISHDPLGLRAGENPYRYCPNSFGWIDPLGLAPCRLNPKNIHFMQSSIKNVTGEHTVLGNAMLLSKGKLKPDDLPAIRVWKDQSGKIWTLDHRRLAAFRLARVTDIPVEWVGNNVAKRQMWKMTTKTGGKSIRLKIGEGISEIVS